VSYCATCDAAFFRDVPVAVIGGGDAALDEALFTTRYASKVYVIHRRDELRASKVLQQRAFASSKIEFIWDTVVERVAGESGVESLALRNLRTGEERQLPVAAMFVFIGQRPASELLGGLVHLDAGGHVEVDQWMETGVAGLFAAGDVRAQSARQLITAAGDGVTAAIRAEHYLASRYDAAA
jgi:thioredoxin reductase (NADPH)